MNGDLRNAEYETIPGFNFEIPKAVAGVDSQLLNPRLTWSDKAAHDEHAKLLMANFAENFKRFTVSDAIKNAGPQAE